MITAQLNEQENHGHIILSPNMSARWQTTKYFLYIVSSVALLIALLFSALGLWLILPFAGLEVLILFIVMYRVSRDCMRQEVIYLNEKQIRVEQGYHKPLMSWQSDIFWTRLIVTPGRPSGHQRRVILRGRESQIEIGRFLNEQDKNHLIKQLRHIIVVV